MEGLVSLVENMTLHPMGSEQEMEGRVTLVENMTPHPVESEQ
jgi:hypothetical protein